MPVNIPSMVVGHRGSPEYYPENSVAGALAAIAAGAGGVEIDVQLTKDGVPVVLHDSTLARVAGTNNHTAVYGLDFAEVESVSVHEPARFGEQYGPLPIISLKNFCSHYATTNCPLFIELKEESLAQFSAQQYVDSVVAASAELASENRIFISYSYELIALAQKKYGCQRCGWILSEYSEQQLQQAKLLSPEIVVCDIRDIPSLAALRDTDWDWFLFDITDEYLARQCVQYGVRYIESWNPLKLCCALSISESSALESLTTVSG